MGHPIHVKEFVGSINEQPWGRTFYVQSTHVNASDAGAGGGGHVGTYPRQPLKTLVKAFANCVAGDRIMIGPNHVETITAATTLDKADVRVIGFGGGDSRPTFTFSTVVGSAFTVSGANNRWENLRFLCGIDAQTALLSWQSAGGKLLGCDFSHSGAYQPLIGITANVANVEIGHCTAEFRSTGMNSLISFAGAGDRMHIHDCYFNAFCATAVIENVSAAADSIRVERNALESLNTTAKPCFLGKSATSGVIRHNTMRVSQGGNLVWIATAGTCSLYENYGVNDDGETGILEGTASS